MYVGESGVACVSEKLSVDFVSPYGPYGPAELVVVDGIAGISTSMCVFLGKGLSWR